MNAAARELGLIAAAKQREAVLAVARKIRAETNQPYDWRLESPMILGARDRVA